MAGEREKNVYMAKLAEQAERYEDMVKFVETLSAVVDTEELTVEERNLLSVAYKNVIGARRASWRIVSSIEQKEEGRGNQDHVSLIRDYRAKIESELSSICDGILKLLDSRLVPSSTVGDAKVFYLKMKGDYHRYLAEFKIGAERKVAAESTLDAYKSAQDIAVAQLSPTHPIRLGLALNFSVFYDEILNSSDRDCAPAKQAFEEVKAELDTVEDEKLFPFMSPTAEVSDNPPLSENYYTIFSLVMQYLDLQDLLSLQCVCKSLRDATRIVTMDPLIWKDIKVIPPFSWKLCDDTLIRITSNSLGHLKSLTLFGSSSCVTEKGILKVIQANLFIEKLHLQRCGVSPQYLLEFAKLLSRTLRQFHIYDFSWCMPKEIAEEIESIVEKNCCVQERKPLFFNKCLKESNKWKMYFDCGNPVDIDVCPMCEEGRLIFDCTKDTCRSDTVKICRACEYCLRRCMDCGECVEESNEHMTACFCNQMVCAKCFILLNPKCNICNGAYCSTCLIELPSDELPSAHDCGGET